MNSILQSLYNTAMENRSQSYLTQDELRDYQSALKSEEKLEKQLEDLLKDEPLRLFRLYADNRDDEGDISSISAFRKGLAIGLKLNFFAMSGY